MKVLLVDVKVLEMQQVLAALKALREAGQPATSVKVPPEVRLGANVKEYLEKHGIDII